MLPKPNGTQDPLRTALAELVALKDGPRDAEYERRKPLAWQAAREALAAEPPEVEWEYRTCADDVLGDEDPEDFELAESLENARALITAFDSEPPYGHVWIERRRKAGEWQRVDDRSDLDLLADALSTPGQQGDRR